MALGKKVRVIMCKREGQQGDRILIRNIRQVKPEIKTYSPIQCRCVNSDTQERSPPSPAHQESAIKYESVRDTSPIQISSTKAGSQQGKTTLKDIFQLEFILN